MRQSADFLPETLLRRGRGAAEARTILGLSFRSLASCLGLAFAVLPAGCGATLPVPGPGGAAAAIATRWHAPLPHGGQLADLRQWWAQFDDPPMLRLIEAGQRVSPTLAEASARIADARAARVSQRAALWPSMDATAARSRERQAFGGVGTVSSATLSTVGLEAGWELDLFGAARAGAKAAKARLESSEAGWHVARVSVAAEVATTYADLRACEAQVRQAELDAASRAQTSQLTLLAVKAGFEAPVATDQANAGAAQGTIALIAQRTQCDLLIKALTALTGEDEAALRRDLATGTARLPRPAELRVTAMPAEILLQRPDLHAAARDVVAAGADSARAQALRWPRIALTGNIGTTRIDFAGASTIGSVWSLGPVTVTLPLFDGGTRRADAAAARARYETATIVYSARLREAIRDVESALVRLDGAAKRSEAARIASQGFDRSYRAVEARYRAGLSNLFDLEDARRSRLAARGAEIEVEHERVSAWIALYRALGGGWSSANDDPSSNETTLR